MEVVSELVVVPMECHSGVFASASYNRNPKYAMQKRRTAKVSEFKSKFRVYREDNRGARMTMKQKSLDVADIAARLTCADRIERSRALNQVLGESFVLTSRSQLGLDVRAKLYHFNVFVSCFSIRYRIGTVAACSVDVP
jgi:hypothetical protein